MCQYPLFETLAIINGKVQNLHFHQQRYQFAMKNYFLCDEYSQLRDIIVIPKDYQTGLVRCRIDYNQSEFKLSFYHYNRKKITAYQCVRVKDFDYAFKYSDREQFALLDKKHADEVIIINNGFVSDCTIGNLLFLKQGKWYTPDSYLLKGTQLSLLLSIEQIACIQIKQDDLFSFEKIMMINALNPFDPARAIEITPRTISL